MTSNHIISPPETGGVRGGLSKSILLALMVLSLISASAQTSTHMLGLGPSRILDTYLTPEHFSGTGYTYLYIRDSRKSDSIENRRWTTTIQQQVDFSSTDDRSGNASNLEGTYNLYWVRYYNLRPVSNLRLQVGASANACLGFIYDMTSSNNPAQARAAINLMPSATAAYDFSFLRQRFTASYELQLPLIGLMFSPNYGQSYYEIFARGNYDHNIVPTTLVSAPDFRQRLSLNWHYSPRYSLSLACLGNYQQSKVNHLKSHVYAHRIMLGITRRL